MCITDATLHDDWVRHGWPSIASLSRHTVSLAWDRSGQKPETWLSSVGVETRFVDPHREPFSTPEELTVGSL